MPKSRRQRRYHRRLRPLSQHRPRHVRRVQVANIIAQQLHRTRDRARDRGRFFHPSPNPPIAPRFPSISLGNFRDSLPNSLPAARNKSLLAERILPTASAWSARRIGRGEIIQKNLAILRIRRRHVVAANHQRDRVVPLRTAHALRSDEFEVVACRARIKGLFAPGAGGEVFRVLVARREVGLRVRIGLQQQQSEQRYDCSRRTLACPVQDKD
jgi:hypothetical protein